MTPTSVKAPKRADDVCGHHGHSGTGTKTRAVRQQDRHRAFFTASVVYIAGSVPLHVYCSYVIWDTSLMTWFPMWFSCFLLIVVYPAFLTLFAKRRYRN